MAGHNIGSLLVGLVVLFHTWRVWAVVEVNMEDRVEVFRGQTAQITCMFTSDEGTGGMVIQWSYATSGENHEIYYQDATMKEIKRGTQFSDRISVKDSGASVVLTINNVQLKDQLEFICLIKSLTDGVGEGRTKLKVFETPQHPTIEGVQGGTSVNEGDPSKIGVCEVRNGFPKPNITWYKNNVPLHAVQNVVKIVPTSTVESSGLVSVGSELNMKVTKEDRNALFYCEVNYFVPGGTRMTETNRINITVYYSSTDLKVWVESPKGKIKEGDSIEIRCLGNGNIPVVLSMWHGSKEHAVEGDLVVLNNVTRLFSGVYRCVSLDTETFEEISNNTSVFVNYLDPVVIEPKDTIIVGQGEGLKATCNALSSLKTYTAWYKNREVVFEGHTLILENATFDTAGTYRCVVTVPEIEKMESSGTLRVSVKGPPKIMGDKIIHIEASFEETVDLSCSVRGFPVPSITWTNSDGKVFKTAAQTETEEGVKSMVSIKVTSDSTVFCNASNEYGADALTFNIKATKNTTTTTTSTSTTTATTSSSSSSSSSSTINAAITTISSPTVKPETAIPPTKLKKEGSGVVIAVIIICILLLAILGSVLYFLYKTGKICGRSGKQDLTKEKSNKDNIVVEMKSDNTEEAILLGVNGEKQLSSDQGGEYLDMQD